MTNTLGFHSCIQFIRHFGDKTRLAASDVSREFFHEGWDDSSESDVGVATV